jgi:hypothetical protein
MRTLGNRTSIPKKTSNVSSINKPKVNVTNTSNSVPVAYADTGKPQIAKPRTIIDDIVNFGQDVYQGASDTVQSYNFFNDRPLNEYRKSSAQDVVIESAMTGKLGEGLGELGRRAQEQPGRLVGELLVEAGIIAGTFGGAAAVKVGATGAKVGAIASKVASNKAVQTAAGVAAKVSEKTPSQVKTVLSAADTVTNLGINKVFDKVGKGSSVFVGSKATQNLGDVILDTNYSFASPRIQEAWGQVTPKGVIGQEVGKYSPSIEKTSGPISEINAENIFIKYDYKADDGGRIVTEKEVNKLVKDKLKNIDFDPNEERIKNVRTRYESTELTSIRDKELGDVGDKVSDITNNFYNIKTFDNRANTGVPLTKDYIQSGLNNIGIRGRTTNKDLSEISNEMDSFIKIATGTNVAKSTNFLGIGSPNVFADILPVGVVRKGVIEEPLGSAPVTSDAVYKFGSSNIYGDSGEVLFTESRVKRGASDVYGLDKLNDAEMLLTRINAFPSADVNTFKERYSKEWNRYFPKTEINPNARVEQLERKLANAASLEEYSILRSTAAKTIRKAQRKTNSYGKGETGEAALDVDFLNKNPVADSPLTITFSEAMSTTKSYTGIRTFSDNPKTYTRTPQWQGFKKDYEEWAKTNPAAKELRRRGVNVPKTAEGYMSLTGATLMDAMRSSSFTNLGGLRYATPKKGEQFSVFKKSDRFKESLKRAQSFLKGETGDSGYIGYTNPDKYSAIVDSSDSSMVLKSIIQNEQGLPLIEKTVNPLTISSRVKESDTRNILSDLWQVDRETGSRLSGAYIIRTRPSISSSGSSFNMYKAPILGWSPDTVKSSVRKVKTKANTSTTTPSTIYSQVFTKKQQKALKASSRKTRSAKNVKTTTNNIFDPSESSVGLPQGYNFSDMMNLQKSAKKKKTGSDDIMSQLRSGVTFRRGGFF